MNTKSRKTERIYMRVTPEEKQQISKNARQNNTSLSEYALQASISPYSVYSASLECKVREAIISNKIYNHILSVSYIDKASKDRLLKELNALYE